MDINNSTDFGTVKILMLKGEKGEQGESGDAGDYSGLTNKPSINGVTLEGNKTASALGLASLADVQSAQADASDAMQDASEALAEVTALQTLVLNIPSFNSLPQTVSDANITSDMVVVNSVLSNPSAQTGDWTITTSDGSLSVSGSISGTTSLTLYLNKSR